MSSSGVVRAAVAGCTGYIGMQCVALLQQHPRVQLTRVMGRSHAGRRHSEAVPGSACDLIIEDTLDPGPADAVFAALPHTVAASQASRWLSAGAVVLDMSADFRLRDGDAYRSWYGADHPAPALCGEAVYGLAEFAAEALQTADLIAVPGCYPTAALLGVLPALREGLVKPAGIVIDAKSGVSGAGRSPQAATSFAEVNESVHAYGVAGHRHKAEMLEQMQQAAGDGVAFTFVPHLVPMTRGILVTAYMRPAPRVAFEQIERAYIDLCARHAFLRYSAVQPATKHVAGSNVAAMHVEAQDGVVVVTVAIDNLLKGAAGQAVQDFNLRFGFDEAAGLTAAARWP